MWPLMPLDETAERAALQALDNNQSEHALRRLMQAYGTEIYRFCYSFMKNRSDAEDMLQLTFMQAYEALEGHSSKSSLRAWLYTIARNRCLDKLKAERRLQTRVAFVEEPPESPMESGDPVGDDQLVAALRNCLARVSTAVRTAVLLRFQRELSYPEMEAILQESAKTLQVRVSRALPELHRCLLRQGISL
ncbi:MAG: RNA polymerase sigma factor [Gammaproteobacteria bacterium]